METYEIWTEGYSANGDSSPASYLGLGTGNTFEEAVRDFATKNPRQASYITYHGDGNITHWGCKMFDNQAAASASFG